jgi:hypothetical protein
MLINNLEFHGVAYLLLLILRIIFCEIKKLLHNKQNGHQIEEAAHRIGENLC